MAAASAPATPVSAAIATAARATGNDFAYLLAQARLESGLNPSAPAATSSARGLYQFTGSTWLRTLDRHAASYGLDWASQAISSGRVRDPAMREQLLALRDDPQLSALMAGELANDNRATLSGALGREPDDAELYLAHFLGGDGASRFLTALAADPGQSAAALLPKAAAANRGIFFDGGGARSLGQVMELLRGRLAAAGGTGTGLPDGFDTAFADFDPALLAAARRPPSSVGGPLAREFHAAAATANASAATAGSAMAGAAPVPTASMAETLASSFALSDSRSTPAHVRAAYGRLRAMGL
ncbi:lytic transglycosylase domain-containing protein [Novosphingobium sp.]|uniref:lytic transglycosylase domain-containing protein n=1 Tax=Novosphingobium sp. TaxID=1874826 RepID=UPI0038BAE655